MLNSKNSFTLDNPINFNFSKKNNYSFTDNDNVNTDFCKYIRYLSSGKYEKLGYMLDQINNKTRIFYMKIDYLTFNKLIKAFYKIRQFYFRIKTPKYKIFNYVNEYSLSLIPINQIKNVISITIKNSIYRFSAVELISIYKYSLSSISPNFYYNQNMIPPKNPYTNIRFNMRENFILFKKIKNYLFSIGKNIPSYLLSYKECYFNLKFYKKLNINKLTLISINKYVSEMSQEDFMIEFNEMIEDKIIQNIYCKHCYKSKNLYKIFKQSVIYYLLNSNNIYIFGNYIREFIQKAKINNLCFDKSHRIYHKLILKKRRRTVRLRELPLLNMHLTPVEVIPNIPVVVNYIYNTDNLIINRSLDETNNATIKTIINNLIDSVIELNDDVLLIN